MLSHRLTDNAELRALEPWQADVFAKHVVESRDHIARWLPWAAPITDAESALPFLNRYNDKRHADEGALYGIWVDDRLAGGITFRTFDAAAGSCELGAWLATWAVGRGLMTTAATALIDWAIHTRGIHRVEWRVIAGNDKSVAVARRLGFTKEGTLRRAANHDGTHRDLEVWGLLAEEWPTAR